MAKSPKTASAIFSYADLAIAGDMTKRAFQHVVDANARSPSAELLPSGGGVRAVKRIAVIGGFMSAGVLLFPAARITAAILPELNTTDGEVHSGLINFVHDLPYEARARIPSSADADFWLHHELIKLPKMYTPGLALRSDVTVEIVDRQRAYLIHGLPAMNPWDKQLDNFSEFALIEGWERGVDVSVVQAFDYLPSYRGDPDDFTSSPEHAAGKAHLDASRAAYANAVGRITVNASLAIRNAFDRISRHRGHLSDVSE